MTDTTDIRQGDGFGYINEDGVICMIRCFECGIENYAIVVNTGQCAWCGYDPNEESE